MKRKHCKFCQRETLAVEEKVTHGCTGIIMLMMLVPVAFGIGCLVEGIAGGFFTGFATFFISCLLMSAKSYRCHTCGSKV